MQTAMCTRASSSKVLGEEFQLKCRVLNKLQTKTYFWQVTEHVHLLVNEGVFLFFVFLKILSALAS